AAGPPARHVSTFRSSELAGRAGAPHRPQPAHPRAMSAYGAEVLAHAALLAASGITPEVARARGYRSMPNTKKAREELHSLGFAWSQCRVPALLIPVHGVGNGGAVTYQLRPDRPRHKDGKPLKYETPAGARMVLDVPPGARAWLGDPKLPLLI